MQITIEEQYKNIINRYQEITKEHESIFNELKKGLEEIKNYASTPQIQTPEFKVGDRVILVKEKKDYTKDMVYKLVKDEDGETLFDIIDDEGCTAIWTLGELKKHFKPYEKPKEGDRVWLIGVDDVNVEWCKDKIYNDMWNLGLAFHKIEQAEFARERLSKLF